MRSILFTFLTALKHRPPMPSATALPLTQEGCTSMVLRRCARGQRSSAFLFQQMYLGKDGSEAR